MNRSDIRAYVPAYVASLFAVGSGVAAVTLSADVPQLTVTMFGFLLLGHAVSFGARMASPWLRTGRFVVTTAAWILVPCAFLSPLNFFFPIELAGDPDLQLAVFMGWLAIASTYIPGSDVMDKPIPVMFPLVPTFSVFGLIAGQNVNTEITFVFVTFIAAGLFLISYEHLLERTQTDLTPLGGLHSVVSRQSVLCAILFAPIVGGALALGFVFQRLTPSFFPLSMEKMRDRMMSYMMPVDNYANSLSTFQLRGGNLMLSSRPVLGVRSEPFVFLRGRVYTTYTGRGWVSEDRQAYTTVSPDVDGRFWMQTGSVPPGHRFVRQYVQPLSRRMYTIYGSGTICSFRGLSSEVRVGRTGAVFASRPLPANIPYEVVSAAFVGSERNLVSLPGVAPTEEWADYLSAPPGASRVVRIAQQVAGKEPTPWRKVEAIANFLASECTYSLQTSMYPFNEEPVTYFLLYEKRGACDMFASAMALMLRAVGVPSRVATGFLLADTEPKDGWFVLRERDAHAWVEFYLPPYGWVPYDPTAGTRSDENSLADRTNAMLASISSQRNLRVYGLPVMVVALLCLVWGAPFVRMLRQRKRRAPNTDDYRGWLIEVYRALTRRLRRWRLPRAAHQTPWEYVGALKQGQQIPEDTLTAVARITDKFVEARYSDHPITREDVAAARAELSKLKKRPKK